MLSVNVATFTWVTEPMELFFLVLALTVLVVTCLAAVDLTSGLGRMGRLSEVPRLDGVKPPRISIIVPACNEEKNIREAMLTQLQQGYTNFEVIAINDRSTDGTGKILDELSHQHQTLRVLHLSDLPKGWMGKAHALQRGAEIAGGDYLLFTDGDISMESSALSRAVHHMEKEKLDHLSVIFKNSSKGWLLNSLILESGAALLQLFRPWLAKKDNSPQFIGVGAFNLVKRTSYVEVGGHESIRMHPIDDIMLGKIIKRGGYHQDCLLGTDLVKVPWYDSLPGMVDGLMKNVLAIINYRLVLLPILLSGMVVLTILPLWGSLLADGSTRLVWLTVVVIKLVMFLGGTRLLGVSGWCAFGTLFTPYISVYIVLRAAWLNVKDRGIIWRGTHYSLDELRQNEPILP